MVPSFARSELTVSKHMVSGLPHVFVDRQTLQVRGLTHVARQAVELTADPGSSKDDVVESHGEKARHHAVCHTQGQPSRL